MDLIKIAEEAFATKKELPSFKSGDTITVAYRIKEDNNTAILLDTLFVTLFDTVSYRDRITTLE